MGGYEMKYLMLSLKTPDTVYYHYCNHEPDGGCAWVLSPMKVFSAKAIVAEDDNWHVHFKKHNVITAEEEISEDQYNKYQEEMKAYDFTEQEAQMLAEHGVQ